MKSEIYKFIAIVFLFITSLFVFKQWMIVTTLSVNCAHIDRVVAHKDGQYTGHPLNELGQNSSCYVEWYLNGERGYSEWWNVGNCSDYGDIEINVVDYTCH